MTYVTAGDPDLPRSREILLALDRAGADVLEVGVPFSDPLADGPVIQRATERALAGGMTLARRWTWSRSVRGGARPIVIFSYANPIYRMGLDAFVARAPEAGVDGVLTLDLPLEEAEAVPRALAAGGHRYNFPAEPDDDGRADRRAASSGSGFLYGISRLGVTGVRDDVADSARERWPRACARTRMPLALGFGISRPSTCATSGECADAAVVGSALVNVIAEHGRFAG